MQTQLSYHCIIMVNGLLKSLRDIRIICMKRILLVLLAATMAASGCFAVVPQKIHPVDSPVYDTISDIYLMTGRAMPSSSGPWSTSELLQMIDAIPRDEVPLFLRDSYYNVRSALTEDLSIGMGPLSMQFNGSATLELYAHTETDGAVRGDVNGVAEKSFTGVGSWAFDMVHSSPFLQVGFQMDVSQTFYFCIDFALKSGFHADTGYGYEVGATAFGSNVPGLKTIGNGAPLSLDPNWPYRAFVSFGGGNWNVTAGRDRLNWGLGRTGNLGISDNPPYYDMVRFTAFSARFKYSFLLSSFPNKVNFYYKDNGDPGYVGSNTHEKNVMEGLSLYAAHRAEGHFFKDKLSVSLTEAVMYCTESGTLDPRILNPLMVFHNLYTPSDTNSSLVLEVDWTPVRGLNIYGQYILDDLAIPGGESAGSPTSYGYPNAMGYLAGVRYAMQAWNGILSFNLEGALIDPYTYIRYNTDPDGAASEAYGLDYIVGTRTYVTGAEYDSLVYDEYVLGYRYGGDCAVADLNVEWKKPGLLTVASNIFLMAHGTHDKWTRWSNIGNQGDDQWNKASVTPTSTHETGNYRYADASARDAVCYTLDIGLGCLWEVNGNLRLFGQADYICLWNSFNSSLNAMEDDFQVVVGARYAL